MLIVFATGAPADHKKGSLEVSALLEDVGSYESGRSDVQELATA